MSISRYFFHLRHSRYELTPPQVIDLHRQGADVKVLDYMLSARDAALRDSFADEINKGEQAHRQKQDALKRQLRSYPYYEPFLPYPY